jgi:hypothetical protein
VQVVDSNEDNSRPIYAWDNLSQAQRQFGGKPEMAKRHVPKPAASRFLSRRTQLVNRKLQESSWWVGRDGPLKKIAPIGKANS